MGRSLSKSSIRSNSSKSFKPPPSSSPALRGRKEVGVACLTMKPAPFNLFRPKSIEEVLALLHSHGDEAKVLAGGQSLVPLMNFRLAQPQNLIDLTLVEGLDQIKFAKRSSKSAIRRSAIVAPSAAVWLTPIRQRSCRSSPLLWTQRSAYVARRRAVRSRRRISITAIS